MIDLTRDSDDDDDTFAPRAAPAAAPRKRGAAHIDLTLDSDSDEGAPPRPVAKAARVAAKAADAAPPWAGKHGIHRLMAEFGALRKWEGSPRVYDAAIVADQGNLWRFKVKDFDDDCAAGRALNKDLATLGRTRRQDHIVMEIRFPDDYPTRPFFLRCVSPRFVWYTGHVTAGGSICIEALTTDGSRNQWTPTHCVEGILNTVFTNMLDTEVVTVRTATGPGGRSGPLRVDLQGKFHRNVLAEYSDQEARAAFDRMLDNHRRNGW